MLHDSKPETVTKFSCTQLFSCKYTCCSLVFQILFY